MRIVNIRKITSDRLSALDGRPEQTIAKRQLREPLLKAFDIYKSNVYYGVTDETEEEHAAVLAWYRALLDLEDSALTAPPPAVARFAEGGGV